MRINVNGKDVEWSGSTIDYGAVLSLANKSAGATVTYVGKRSGDMQRSGILTPHKGAIAVGDGMSFTAVHTSNA